MSKVLLLIDLLVDFRPRGFHAIPTAYSDASCTIYLLSDGSVTKTQVQVEATKSGLLVSLAASPSGRKFIKSYVRPLSSSNV